MENYDAFLARIDSFEKPELHLGDGDFVPNPSMQLKVDSNNAFRPFFGDTTVFDLADSEKALLRELTDILYSEVPECFCERLVDSTFHMTLHDLSNSPEKERAARCMPSNRSRLCVMLEEQPVTHHTIRMRSKAVFNMVNTSLVVGLYPVDAQEYDKLMALYQLVDAVRTLPYPLTPHITLAYYNSAGFDYAAAKKLEQVVNRLNLKNFDILLDTKRLVYQQFESMNDYHTRFHF